LLNFELMRKIYILTILLICILVGIQLSIFKSEMNHVFEKKNMNDLRQSSVGNPSIVIESDLDFETHGFVGTGTENDPYLIEDIVINSTDMYSSGIYITGTTKHFIIKNCTIDVNVYAVEIYNITSGTAKIINNTIFSCYYGIFIELASGTLIINNTITKYRYGPWPFGPVMIKPTIANVDCRDSNNLMILNNNCTAGWDAGIHLFDCNYVDIIKTNFKYSLYGITFPSSSYISVINCTFAYHWYGGINLGVGGSDYLIIEDNKFEKCGLIVGMSYSRLRIESIKGNIVNGKLLGYFEGRDGLILNESIYGQIILYECGSVTISNQILDECSVGLIIMDSSLYVNREIIITNISSCYNQDGIRIYEGANLLISNNNLSFNYHNGINIISSWNSEYSYNLCSYNNETGIFFDGNEGRYIGSKPHDNLIFNNKLIRNDYGIYMWYTDNTEISYNLIQDNLGRGVGIGMNSEGNIVHHNRFIDNCPRYPPGSSQGFQDYDESPNNLWYDPSSKEGNYWSDWNGTGPYRIYSFEGAVYDLYPLNENLLRNPPSSIGGYDILFLVVTSLLFSLAVIKKIKAK